MDIIAAVFIGLAPEGGYLNDLAAPETDMRQPESASDQKGVLEEFLDFAGSRIRNHI